MKIWWLLAAIWGSGFYTAGFILEDIGPKWLWWIVVVVLGITISESSQHLIWAGSKKDKAIIQYVKKEYDKQIKSKCDVCGRFSRGSCHMDTMGRDEGG